MKFSVPSITFRKALERVAKSIPKKTSLPDLGMIHVFTINDKSLGIESTNLRVFSKDEIEADISTQGSILVPPSIIKVLPDDGFVTLEVISGYKVSIILEDGTKCHINGRNSEDFPEVFQDGIQEHSYTFPSLAKSKEDIKSLLGKLKYAAHCSHSLENSLQGFRGLYFVPGKDENLETLSVDGNRLAVSILKGSYQKEDKRDSFPLGMDELKILESWLKTFSYFPNQNSALSLFFLQRENGAKSIRVSNCFSSITLLCTQAEMLEYHEYLEEDSSKGTQFKAVFKRKELETLIKKFRGVSSDPRMGFEFRNPEKGLDGKHTVYFPAEDEPEISTPMPEEVHSLGNIKGDYAMVAFQSRHLIEALKTMEDNLIEFFCDGEGFPAYFYGENEKERTVIMTLQML